MRMLFWVNGHTIKDKIRNECIRDKVGGIPIEENMVESCLRWFGNVRKRLIKALLKRIDQMKDSLIIRDRGKLWKTLKWNP